MDREVKHLYVRMSNDRIMCSCPCSEFKLCVERLKNDYECIEAMVGISPVVRVRPTSEVSSSIKSFDKSLNSLDDALKKVSRHMRKM